MSSINFKDLLDLRNNLEANQYYSTQYNYNDCMVRIYISTYGNNPFFLLITNVNETTVIKDITFFTKKTEKGLIVNINKFWKPEDYKHMKYALKTEDNFSFDPFYEKMMQSVITLPLNQVRKSDFPQSVFDKTGDSKYFFCIARGVGMKPKQYKKSCAIIGKRDTDILKSRNIGIRFTPDISKKREFSIDLSL